MKASDILPDGVDTVERNGRTLRKGSVAAFVANVKLLEDPALSAAKREEVTRDLTELIPVLADVGVFDVFEVRAPEIRALVEAHERLNRER